MATVKLADIINVTVFKDLPAVNSPEKTAFYESGVVIRNSLLDELATAPGKTAELPFWNDIDPTVAPNISSDDPTVLATPSNIIQGEQISRKAFLNKGLSASNLASELAMGPKAMDQIRARVDKYWQRQWQRRLIASVNGLLTDNVAANSSDMVFNTAVETLGSQTALTQFNRDGFTDAAYTLGDAVDGLAAVGMHSKTLSRAIKNDDVIYIPDSKGELTIPTYLGLRIIVDDFMPVRAGTTSGFVYTTVLFGPGAFGWGEGTPEVPVEIENQPAQGNGAGVQTLWTRKTQIIHPFGYQNTGTPAGNSFTLAELALATTWARVVDRKLVPICFYTHN